MPIDTSIFKDVSPSETIEANDLRDRVNELQRFVNGQIESTDLKVDSSGNKSQIIKTSHIFKPEFFGSPSPQIIGVSSDTIFRRRSGNKLSRYYRHEGIGSSITDSQTFNDDDYTAWQPIEGMSSTVYVHEQSSNSRPFCMVMGNMYVFESGGKVGEPRGVLRRAIDDDFNDGKRRESLSGFTRCREASRFVAVFALFVDKMDGNGPQPDLSTRRVIYGTGGGRYRCRRMNHSFASSVDLSLGENKISYRCWYRLRTTDNQKAKHVYIDARNFVVDVLYK
tara:strand:- start:43 stop:882 length:840 start_codon:yes stop_codon:yes gene_type:complete